MLFDHPFAVRSQAVANRVRRGAKSQVEALEVRSMMSVSLGSDGYTDVTKSGDSKVIYVPAVRRQRLQQRARRRTSP